MHHILLPIHIFAGGLAMVLGAVALSVKKGGTLHRRSGLLFVYVMLVMGISASILEFLKTPNWANVLVALMTAYFVGTALTTVRPASPWTRRINAAALTIVVGLALGAIAKAVSTPAHPLNINAGFSISGWLAVLLTFLLARVFSEGALMREDLEGTV